VRKTLERKNETNKFVAKLRRKAESDGNDSVHMILGKALKSLLEDFGAISTTKEWMTIQAPLTTAKTGEIDYRQFLNYVYDKKKVIELMTTPISALAATRKDGKTPRNEFVLPRYTKGAHSAGLNSIGKKFIERGANYEDWLMNKLPPTVKDRTNPGMTRKDFVKCCEEAAILLENEEKRALE